MGDENAIAVISGSGERTDWCQQEYTARIARHTAFPAGGAGLWQSPYRNLTMHSPIQRARTLKDSELLKGDLLAKVETVLVRARIADAPEAVSSEVDPALLSAASAVGGLVSGESQSGSPRRDPTPTHPPPVPSPSALSPGGSRAQKLSRGRRRSARPLAQARMSGRALLGSTGSFDRSIES